MLIRPKLFFEELDGTTLEEINKKIDYKKSKLADRKKVVEDILDTKFFEEYFDEFYNAHPTNEDALSEQDAVCLTLERLGTYLLSSNEIKEERNKEDVHYKFVTSKRYFQKKIDREAHYDEIADGNMLDVIIFEKKEKNYLKCKQQKIVSKDYTEGEMGRVLEEYKKFIELVNEENLRTKTSRRDKKTARLVSSAHYDMLNVKNSYKGTIDFKNITKNVGERFVGDVDYSNIRVVDAILKLGDSVNEINDVHAVILDMNTALEKLHLSDLERNIVERYRLGLAKQAIANELNISRPYVFQKLTYIEKRLVELLK